MFYAGYNIMILSHLCTDEDSPNLIMMTGTLDRLNIRVQATV